MAPKIAFRMMNEGQPLTGLPSDDPAAVLAPGRGPAEPPGLPAGELVLDHAVGGQERGLVGAGRQPEPQDLDHS